MTWNPLKKNHLTQRPTFATPLLTQAEDRELDITVQKLMHVEEIIRRLMKKVKEYLDAVAKLDRTDQHLTSTLSTCNLVHTNDDFRRIVEEYHSVTTQIGKNVQEMGTLSQKTFVEPLKKLHDEFAYIASAIAKREELLAKWKTTFDRLKKLLEKKDNRMASHIAKLEKERRIEEAAAKELKIIHTQLLQKLPTFLEKQLEYIKPTVHALILIQTDYHGNTNSLFAQLMPLQNASGSPGSAMVPDDEYQKIISSQMNRIRALTIVKDQ